MGEAVWEDVAGGVDGANGAGSAGGKAGANGAGGGNDAGNARAVPAQVLPAGALASMEPAGLMARYLDARTGEAVEESRDAFAPFETAHVDMAAAFDGEVLEVAVVAKTPVLVERMRVVLRHAFASDERVLLNGYQSWTDTVERPAWSRMRGLRGVPRALVRRFALDGSGDYGMVGYSAKRGQQHGFTYATFRRGEGTVLVGSLGEDGGFTVIRTDANAGEVTLETECPVRVLQAGERCVLGRYAIVRGTQDACYDRWFALSGVTARPVLPLVGYTSWYRHYGDIAADALLADLDGLAGVFGELGLLPVEGALRADGDGPVGADAAPAGAGASAGAAADGFAPLFQIDDGYSKVGDWLEVDRAKFPEGLAPVAAEVRRRGLLPGLWIAPFVCERDSRLFVEKPEWLLRDAGGNPVPTGSHWSGGFALDTRNVEVRSYLLDVLRTIVREWGFGLLKVDFLYAACMFPHDGLNRGQLMADALDLLRTGAGEEALVLGCGVPLGPAFGRVDYCRIGCDVGLDWDDMPHMRLLHRERVSTKRSLSNTYGRAPLDGRAFGNDPDVFFLRRDVKLTEAQRNELLFTDADLGSMLLTSDDMGAWTAQDRAKYREAVRVLLSRARG